MRIVSDKVTQALKKSFKEDDFVLTAPSLAESRLMTRIYTLETQMAFILVVSALFLVATVGMFLIYVCFWERNLRDLEGVSKDVNVLDYFTQEPVLFGEHKLAIEFVNVIDSKCVASCCLEGEVHVWDIDTGKRVMVINRDVRNQKIEEIGPQFTEGRTRTLTRSARPQIWCMAARQGLLFFGCADGTLEIANPEAGNLVGIYRKSHSDSGIIHLLTPGLHIILVRFDGSVEFLDTTLSSNKLQRIKEVAAIQPQRISITHIEATFFNLITVSQDRTVKVFDIRSAQLLYRLKQHNARIISICVDPITNMLYTSCEEGSIYSWDLENGKFLRTIDEVSLTSEWVKLACTPLMLLGYSSDGHLWIWDKNTGQLSTRITPDTTFNKQQFGKRCLIVVSNHIAVTGCGDSIMFWDLNYKVMAKQLKMKRNLLRHDRDLILVSRNFVFFVASKSPGKSRNAYQTQDMHS
ncbi:unnamed protein product [Enterobius vermicularis]|uniref:WD_REPEATS_REGION domain-containing protein n=1 Tax=Enterobius vermicularis TaxID=51028 RepID=A0A0N4UW88_ENTVE|nr:unnamed protein product [Enterobius vermicularis]